MPLVDTVEYEGGEKMRDMREARILLVDDQPELLTLVETALRQAGYRTVDRAQSCAEARRLYMTNPPEVMVLDINLPDGDGFSLFQELRRQADTPALFLSARDADDDRLFGLGLGADDYLTKPFLMQELLLRLQGVLRRAYRLPCRPEVKLGPCTVRLKDATVDREGRQTALTATELALLQKLADNRGHIVTFDALCEAVWGDGYYGYENVLGVHIRHLREKVENDPSHPRYLLTVRGLGYKLEREEQP